VLSAGSSGPSVVITPLVGALSLAGTSSLSFSATQPLETVSAPQTLTITNTGTAPLYVDGLTFGGADPGDFVVDAEGCTGATAATDSCTVAISFAPQATGARSATLEITSSDPSGPASVGLSGTGGTLPQGATSATGATGSSGAAGVTGASGAMGATGATGPRGSAGKIELVTCRSVTRRVKGRRRTVQVCTTKEVSGTMKFTATGAAVRATLSRGGTIIATGTAPASRSGDWQLRLSGARPLTAGRYTLALSSGSGAGAATRRVTIGQ
jgi:hypothetical protein